MINISILSQNKVVTLEFHDGPTENTLKILEILKKYKAKAVFCVIGKNIEKYPVTAKKIAQDGHILCNHTYSHPDMNNLTLTQIKNEIKKTNMLIKKYTGVDNYLYAAPFIKLSKNYINAVIAFKDSKISRLEFDDTYNAELTLGRSFKKHILSNLKNGLNKFILHLEHPDKTRKLRITEFNNILDTLVKLKYKIEPDPKKYTDPLKLKKLFTNSNKFIDNSKKTYIEIFNNKAHPPNNIYLLLYGFDKYGFEIISFMKRRNIPINVALRGIDTMLNIRYLNIIEKYKIVPLIHFYSNELNCNNLGSADIKELKDTQILVYHLTGKIIKTAFINCPLNQINNSFLTNLSKKKGFNRIVSTSKWVGNNIPEYIYTLTHKAVTYIIRNFYTAYEMSLDEQEMLYKYVDEFFKGKKMKAFMEKTFNNALKTFAKSIKAGDIIVIGTWKRDLVIAAKKIIKLLKNRGFKFGYIK